MGYAAFFERHSRKYQCIAGKKFAATAQTIAGVAQLVEQRIRNAKVGCSIHLTGTTNILCGFCKYLH